MQVSALLSRLERKLARTCGVAKDQRCSKMTSLPTAGSRDGKIRLVSYRHEAYEPKPRSYEDAFLAHDDGAQSPKRVIRVVLTIRRSLPVYPDERTFSVRAGMSQTCGHSRMLKHIAEFFAI
jgi:hypothetical protein